MGWFPHLKLLFILVLHLLCQVPVAQHVWDKLIQRTFRFFFKLPTEPSKVNTAAYFRGQQRYFCKGQDLRAHPFFRMNDETAMAGGKVSRSGGGNEPPLTDKRAELHQVAQTMMTSAQQFTLQNKSQTSVTSESIHRLTSSFSLLYTRKCLKA